MKAFYAFLAVLMLASCAPPAVNPAVTASPRTTLTVLAAASLTEPFKEIAQVYESAHPGVTISFNFAGSQQLAQQLANGSPADVFASANQKQMDAAVNAGRVESGAPVEFVRNRLVVVLPGHNPGGIETLEDLALPGLKIILASEEVPVGQYSLEMLRAASTAVGLGQDYADRVLANVVSYEENVRVVVTKVALGEADAGIVYASDAAQPAAARLRQVPIPEALNVEAAYPIAVVVDSRRPELAQAFVDLVLSAQGQQILTRYGFIPAAP